MDDVLIIEDPGNPEYMFGAEVSDVDGRYLILYTNRDTAPVRQKFPTNNVSSLTCTCQKNKLWIADLATSELGPNIRWNKIIDTFDAAYE